MWKHLEDWGENYVVYSDSAGEYGVYDKKERRKYGASSVVVCNRKSKTEAIKDAKEILSYGKNIEELGSSNKMYSQGFSLDPKIKDAVVELNSLGFHTVGSCQGHRKGIKGFITFDYDVDDDDKKFINLILKKYGASQLRWDKFNDWYVAIKFYI